MKYNFNECLPIISIFVPYYEEDEIFNENTIFSKTSGLKYKLWINNNGSDATYKHHLPRLKIEVDNKLYPVIFYPYVKPADKFPPKVNRCIKSCEKFIIENQFLFKQYWDRKIDWNQVLENIKKV